VAGSNTFVHHGAALLGGIQSDGDFALDTLELLVRNGQSKFEFLLQLLHGDFAFLGDLF